MYAMDHAPHTEHRTDTRRSRWDLRRTSRSTEWSTAPTTQPTTTTAVSEATPQSPVHDFVD